MFTPPAEVSAVLSAFAPLFTHPSWARAQALLCGVLLAPANHTVTAALRALGLAGEPGFQNYHRVLNRARWSARQAAQVLLRLLVDAFVPSGPVILGLDDTVERRRGRKLTARAIYYDAARSSKACFQKTSGLRWLSVAVLVPVRSRGTGLGAALSERPVPFGTLRPVRTPGPAAHTAARARPGAHRPSASLAAGSRAHRGGRRRVRRPGVFGLVRASGSARDGHYPLALGCGPLCPGPRAPARPARPVAPQRPTLAQLSPAP
jgi:hypothetical protein